MKYSKIYLLTLFIFAALVLPSELAAQDKEGNITFSFGAGYSLKYGFIVPNNSSYTLDSYEASPVYNGSLDFASIDKLSIGLAASYQMVSSETYGYYYNDVIDPGFGPYFNFEENLNILNVGVRIQYHFLPSVKEVDLYTGGRIGMTFWDYSSNYDNAGLDTGYERLLHEDNNLPTFQLGFGLRYYATPWLGLNVEAMLGNGPYSMLLGANLKFGGEK